MADGDVYKTTLEWRYASIDVAVNNVLYFRQDGVFADPLIVPELNLGVRLAAAMPASGGWGGDFRNLISTDYSVLNVRVQRLYPVLTSAYITPVNRAGLAPGGANVVPSVAALVVRLRSTLNTARGRGRIYLGGFSFLRVSTLEPVLANAGYWNAPTVVAANAYVASLFTRASEAISGEASFTLGVWSKTVAGPHPPYANGFSPFVSGEATSAIRVQRRREVGVGI